MCCLFIFRIEMKALLFIYHEKLKSRKNEGKFCFLSFQEIFFYSSAELGVKGNVIDTKDRVIEKTHLSSSSCAGGAKKVCSCLLIMQTRLILHNWRFSLVHIYGNEFSVDRHQTETNSILRSECSSS